jgi:hypothetical protein
MSESGGARECECPKPDTHPLGFTFLTFLLSLLWLRIQGQPVFPLGFLIAVTVAFWHKSIEEAIYGRNHLTAMVLVSIFGAILGFLIR